MTARNRWILLVALALIAIVALVVVLVASGGGDDSGSDDPEQALESGEDGAGEPPEGDPAAFTRDACELLTAADVRQVLGRAVEGEYTEGDAETFTPGQCNWATDRQIDVTAPEPRPAAIQIQLGDSQIFDNTRSLAENGDDYAPVEDLGDDAYAGGGFGGLLIEGAGITVVPIGINVNDPATRELIVDVLERVASNY